MEEAGDNDPLEGFTNTTKDIGKSSFNLIQTIGRVIIALVISVLGLKWMMSKSGQDIKDKKDWAVNIVIGSIIFFGVNYIITILFDVSTKFNVS